jgi:uncharacterized protein
MSFYRTVREMKKLLHNLDGCLEKAVAHAAAKKYDVDLLLQCRLAPDMLPLMFQIQAACDQSKYAASRAANKEAPSNPDTEKTMADARKRIATQIAHLDTFQKSDFDGIEDRTLSLPRWEGKSMIVADYVTEHAVPNFFFHLTMAYAILRHNGVDVGKRDYIGSLSFR